MCDNNICDATTIMVTMVTAIATEKKNEKFYSGATATIDTVGVVSSAPKGRS